MVELRELGKKQWEYFARNEVLFSILVFKCHDGNN